MSWLELLAVGFYLALAVLAVGLVVVKAVHRGYRAWFLRRHGYAAWINSANDNLHARIARHRAIQDAAVSPVPRRFPAWWK